MAPFAFNAWATTIAVNNHSFETANALNLGDCGTDCAYNIGSIPGWTSDSVGGDRGSLRPGNPANTLYFEFLPDGSILGYTNGPFHTQTVGETVLEGLVYTLLVEVGNGRNSIPSGTVDLIIGTTVYSAPVLPIVEGGWTTYSVTYTGTAADAGKPITIRLGSSFTQDGSGHQGVFDNVRLNAEAVPEAGSLGLAGFGIACVVWLRRRLTLKD